MSVESIEPAVRVHFGHAEHTPVVTGCPCPADMHLDEGAILHFDDGSTCFAQAVPLTAVTPEGVRWWELSFLSVGGGDVVVRPAIDDGGQGGDMTGKAPIALESESGAGSGGGVSLDNGIVRVDLHAQASDGPPVTIAWPGGTGRLTPQVDTTELGPCREATDAQRTVRILRNGPVRAQVELLTTLDGVGPAGGAIDCRLTIELWHGHAAARVDWMLTHRVAGHANLTVTRATLRGLWNVTDGGDADTDTQRVFRQTNYSAVTVPRDVVNPDAVAIVADDQTSHLHVADPAMLRDDAEYPFYCRPPTIGTGDWLELRGRRGRVAATVIDFAETRPNALTSERDELSYHMVPADQPLTWAQGWRKEQHLLLAFAAADESTSGEPGEVAVEPADLAARAKAVFPLGRAQPTPECLRSLRCFDLDRILAFEPGRHLRMNALLAHVCQLMAVARKFDLGDTPDWHYTSGYAGAPNQYVPLPGAEDFPRTFFAKGRGGYTFPDVMKYFVQPVWTNNEYDMIHALATEHLRTGKADTFTLLRWSARHNVEVDFLSYSDDPWHHRASPFHSQFHNTKGAITSHFWTQGLVQYYCLTGDRDVLEVATALGDKIISFDHDAELRKWQFDREIGWALLSLCSLAEAGLDAKYLDEARTIATYLQGYDRKSFSGAVKLSAGQAGRSLERQMVDAGFGYSSMVEALDRFGRLTGDEAFDDWFGQLLLEIRAAVWEKIADGERPVIRDMTSLVMAIGYERTGESDFLAAGRVMLEAYLDPCLVDIGSITHQAGGERGEVKPSAMAYRGLHRLLGALDRAGELDRYEYAVLRERRKSIESNDA